MASMPKFGSLFTEHTWVRDVDTRRHRFLAAIDGAIPWDELLNTIRPCYPSGKRGRQPIPLASMLRLHVYQLCRDLSDQQAVDDMLENRLVEAFCGWDITLRPALDRSTLTKFRRLLRVNGHTEWLHRRVIESLTTAGLTLKQR